MKFPANDGVIIDTDKMSDKEAAITEALQNLYKVCKQFDVTAFARVIMDANKYSGMTAVTGDKNKVQDDFDFLMGTLAKWIDEVTHGQLAVVKVGTPET